MCPNIIDFSSFLENRIQFLTNTIHNKSKALVQAPTGRIRITTIRNNVYYYLLKKPGDCNGQYIRREDISLAKAIAQRDYDKKVIKKAEKELLLLDKLKKIYDAGYVEQIYDNLPLSRKQLVEPILIPDDEYIRRWEGVPYEKLGFPEDAPEYYTSKNERVRSKTELYIANTLHSADIPYRYEYPLQLSNGIILHPDFMLLHKKTREEIIWEHLGMMDSPDYAKNALRKINQYYHEGFYPGKNLILTHETSDQPISTRLIHNVIQKYLID